MAFSPMKWFDPTYSYRLGDITNNLMLSGPGTRQNHPDNSPACSFGVRKEELGPTSRCGSNKRDAQLGTRVPEMVPSI